MKKSQIWALVIILLGVVVILIPWQLFPVCGVGRYAPPAGAMPRMHGCDGTLKAATYLGIITICAGLLPLFFKQHLAGLISAVSTAVIGVLLILFPTVITGVCKVPTMPCVFGTKPALIMAGIVLILVAGSFGIMLMKKKK
ncbi:MAG TPA: DUF4418 family protein [Desulfomonilia bacterium]